MTELLYVAFIAVGISPCYVGAETPLLAHPPLRLKLRELERANF